MKSRFFNYKVTLLLVAIASLLASCQQRKFHVDGTITNATDSVLYFENMALDGIVTIDSVILKADGKFSFSGDANDAPEFYRLRIDRQIINLSVDSTETISVKADYQQMSMRYDVEGSDNCKKIRELSLLQYELQARINSVVADPSLGVESSRDSIMSLIDAHKHRVTIDYIYREPMKAYAYFALFQYVSVGDAYMMIFDPRRSPDDVKTFAAVATNWDANYPDALRTQNLHNIAIESMRDKRIVDRRKDGLVIDADKFEEVNLIDIELTDNKGNLRRLTDLKGKVVLLDFHQFGKEGSAERIMLLRDIYNKYHERGFEIFQVAVGTEEHFWKTQTAALPWISVRDANGAASNAYLAPAPAIPCSYLIDRNNIVVRGARQMNDIEKEVLSVLN